MRGFDKEATKRLLEQRPLEAAQSEVGKEGENTHGSSGEEVIVSVSVKSSPEKRPAETDPEASAHCALEKAWPDGVHALEQWAPHEDDGGGYQAGEVERAHDWSRRRMTRPTSTVDLE